MGTIAEDRKASDLWDDYLRSLLRAAVVDQLETQDERLKRMADLEKPGNEEKWFKYYFPNYYFADAAPFHIASTQWVMKHMEGYLVRRWSREMAKDARAMMEIIKLALTKRKRSVILISSSKDKAVLLLKPFKINFESNPRIINDYGPQESFGEWTEAAFTTKGGCSFIAIGKGQTPRGLRNEEVRPDLLLITDMDTDEDCRNPDTIDNDWAWFEKAAYGTRSVSRDFLVIFLGNIIAEYCCILKASEMADRVETINIEDENGNSNWPQKNTLEHIARIKAKISYAAFQGEYMNNPITTGKVFPGIYYKKLPALREYRLMVCYTDPSYKDGKKNDYKAVVLVGKHKDEYHVRKVFCRQTTTAIMLAWIFQVFLFVRNLVNTFFIIEWPWIDDPIKREIQILNARHNVTLPLTADERVKLEKKYRIETLLEPLNRNGKLWFNIDERDTEDMKAMEAQFKAFSATSRAHDDGPDAVEGAVFTIDSKTINNAANIQVPKRPQNNKRV